MTNKTPFQSLDQSRLANDVASYDRRSIDSSSRITTNSTVRNTLTGARMVAPLSTTESQSDMEVMLSEHHGLTPGSLQAGNLFGDADFLLNDLNFSTPNIPPILRNVPEERPVSPTAPTPANNGSAEVGLGHAVITPNKQRAYVEEEFGRSDEEDEDDNNHNKQDTNIFSRIGSPLPSLRNLPGLESWNRRDREPRSEADPGPCWKVSQAEYMDLQADVAKYAQVLPLNFALPSRHTVSHYLERTINSLYRHQPCVHVPTFKVRESLLELILAMCAVGAQLRFESQAGVSAFHASKAILLWRLRDDGEESVVPMHQPPLRHQLAATKTSSMHSLSPTSTAQRSFQPNDSAQPQFSGVEHRSQAAMILPARKQRLQRMQAILTLMSFGSWGPRESLSDAIMLQTLLAMLVRQEGFGLGSESTIVEGGTRLERWHAWIELESWRRIKTVSYYFINLQSLAYNAVPQLTTAELQCNTPGSANEWTATSAPQWEETHASSTITSVPFQTAFQCLFRRDWDDGVTGNSQGRPSISALGNYALIMGILQCIFFLRQRHPVPFAWDTDIDEATGSSLRTGDIRSIIHALHRWQLLWEKCPESTIEPETSASPISFNAIACLRLAWIRIYADLGPSRNLATRDPNLIAQVFTSGPPLRRHPQLTPVILQAIHALSVPIRLGIRFVARSQTMFWSVNQSMCVLECAVVLSKWFDALASSIDYGRITKQERSMLLMLRAMVLESGFFTEADLSALSIAAERRSLASSVSPSGIGVDVDGVNGAGHAHTYQHSRDEGGSTVMPPGPADNNSDQLGTSIIHGDFDIDMTQIFGIDAGQWILQEMTLPTPPSPEVDASSYWHRQISSLRVAVARLWAEVLSDSHVFDLVTTIGRTLNIHSRVMADGMQPISMGPPALHSLS